MPLNWKAQKSVLNKADRIMESTVQWITPSRIRFVSISIVAIAFSLLLASFLTSNQRQTAIGTQLGLDYANFYVAGTILNSDSPERLYDQNYQNDLYHQLLPKAPADSTLPYPYAPFFGIFLKPFAWMSFEWSYALWLTVGLVLYSLGFFNLWNCVGNLDRKYMLDSYLIAISFFPFILEGWIGGQSVGWIVFFFAASYALVERKREVAGGMVLALLSFKPTLMILVFPMLLFRRKYKMLAGFVAGGILLSLVSWYLIGTDGIRGYIRFMQDYAQLKTSSPDAFRTFKYVDLTSFSQLLFGSATGVRFTILIISALVGLVFITHWIKCHSGSVMIERLEWSMVLLWTPILSPQCAIYDLSLLVPAALLAYSAIALEVDRSKNQSSIVKEHSLLFGFLSIYLLATITQLIAEHIGVQIITPVLAVYGFYLLQLTTKFDRSNRTEISN